MLAKHHLQDKRDMTIIEVRFPDQNNAEGGQGRSDQRGLALRLDPDLLATLRTLFNQDEAVGRSQMIIRVTRDGFLKKHRAKMVDSIEDYLHALHYLADPLHHQEAVEIVAEATKQKPASFEGWIFTDKDYYRDLKALPNHEALPANVDLQQSPFRCRDEADASFLLTRSKGLCKARVRLMQV
jgi:hypothetical protein